MSSITAQQTKLDLKLVPKENRLDIGKCNGRIPCRLTPREPTFQVVLDAIALTPCYPAFLITADIPEIFPRVPCRDFDPLHSKEDIVSFLRELGHTGVINSLNDVVFDQMHQPWRTFAALINRGLSGKTSGLDKLRLSRAQILWGVVPPKMARKFKKASPSKKDSDLVLVDEEPETKYKSKEKEKLDITRGKGIELLFEVALTEEAQMKEVRNKSLRDFHKTHPSGSGTVAKKPPSIENITPTGNDDDDNNNDQDSSNEDSEKENESEEQVSDSEQEEESKDDDQEEEEFVHNPSPTDDKDNDNLESENDDVNKSDEESKDVFKGDKEIVQGEGADAEMTDAQQGNENLETTKKQVVKDAHVTISTVMKKTKIPVTSSSRSSDLASKFLNFSDIPHTDAKIVSPLDVHVHHEVLKTQAPTLLTIPVSVITESSPVYTNIPQSLQTVTPPPILTTPNPPSTIETTNPLSTLPDFASVFQFNDRITALEKEVSELKKDPLHTQIRPKEVSKFAPPVIEALIKESRNELTLAKQSRKDKDKDEEPSARSDRVLKKRKLSKDAEPTTGPKKKDSTSSSSKGTKSQPKSSKNSVQSEEPCSRLQTQIYHKIKKGIWVIMKMSQGMRLILDVTSSRNLHHLKNPLTLTDIPHTDAKKISPLDVHVHHEVLKTQAPTLLTIPVSVITKSSPVYTNIPQSLQTVTPPPILTTPNPPSTIETTNPLSILPDFASVFQFNDRITALEKEVSELKKDPLHTQILPKEVSKFASPVIEALIKESRDEVTLAKVSSQPHSTYEAASTLTKFVFKSLVSELVHNHKLKKPQSGKHRIWRVSNSLYCLEYLESARISIVLHPNLSRRSLLFSANIVPCPLNHADSLAFLA
ncbi:hypothetical protein Tco_0476121 [Tanacetum coccineum]